MSDNERMKSTGETLIGESPAIETIRAEMEHAARSDAKVLLTGESGVGKDIVARLIHQGSSRAHMPLVTINCVSVPESLLEPELFGHVRGSFTGAYRDRPGLLEVAHRGTVFLDEVCEMSPRMQALLLRFLESGEIQRVGADRVPGRLDVRVIAATNCDPIGLVASKAFREDLYYRLNVIDIKIPPLRERRSDIPLLFDYFLNKYAARHRVAPPTLAADTLKYLVEYQWPGNVRQLKNVAERLIVRGGSAIITIADFPREIAGPAAARAPLPGEVASSIGEDLYDRLVKDGESFWSVVYPAFMTRDLTRDDVRAMIAKGLRETSGNYRMLVELLNMKPTDYKRFLNFLRKHECQVPFERFRSVRLRHRPKREAVCPAPQDCDAALPVLESDIPIPDPDYASAVGAVRR